MTAIGRTIVVKGDVRTDEDLTIEGRIEGAVVGEKSVITIAASAEMTGDVLARDITVFGRAHGQLVASEVIDVRAEARVSGQIITKRFILADGAQCNGRVEPQHLEAALRVARFNQKKRA
jgi:cytoskeletal protein CcmA (bactofilin family)